MYEPVKREDIDLNEKYCIWVTGNEYEQIHPDDLNHYKATGELYYNGYEVSDDQRKSMFKQPVYQNGPKHCWWINGGNICHANIKCLEHEGFYATEEEARATAIKDVIAGIEEDEKSLAHRRSMLKKLLVSRDEYGSRIRNFGEK